MAKEPVKNTKLKPLKMTCTTADCAHGMHSFIPKPKMIKEGQTGKCRYCLADPVDWKRVHRRSIADVEFTIKSLKHERIRKEYWEKPFDAMALAYAQKKGMSALHALAEHRIRKYLPPVLPKSLTFDGRQTKKEGNPVFYAQHATGTCCRKCVLEWHNIPKEVALSEEQILYLAALVKHYLGKRLPKLPDAGQ